MNFLIVITLISIYNTHGNEFIKTCTHKYLNKKQKLLWRLQFCYSKVQILQQNCFTHVIYLIVLL